MSFVHPEILYLLALVPVLTVFKLAGDRRARRLVGRVVAPRLAGRLAPRTAGVSAWTAHLLFLLAIALMLVALARPQWGFVRDESSAEGRDVLIAIDTSRSMLASDLAPNRLERARLAAQDLIRALPSDRFGMVAFAGRAFLQAPLTIDHEAVLETLAQIDVDIIPRGGTNLAAPLEAAIEASSRSESGSHALVLFSDGDNLEGELEPVAREAREAGLMVIAVGVGTARGEIVPDPEQAGQFLRDDEGNVVRTRLERASLETLAQLTNGAYLDIGGSRDTARRIVDSIETIEKTAVAARDQRRPIERFQWPLGAAAACLALALVVPLLAGSSSPARSPAGEPGPRRASRSGEPDRQAAVTMTIAVVMAVAATAARAAPLPATRAWQDYQEGAYESAIEQYGEASASTPMARQKADLEFGRGASAYRAGEYDTALEAFGAALLSPSAARQEQAHYNLGNTLFRRGEIALEAARKAEQSDPAAAAAARETVVRDWVESIDQYDAALDLNADSGDAAFNRDVVEKRLEQLLQEMQQKQQQQQEGGEGGEGEPQPQEGEGEGEGQPQDGSQSSGEGQENGEPRDQGQQGDEGQEDGQGSEDRQDEGEGGDDRKDNPQAQEGEGQGGEGGEPEGELEALRQQGQDQGGDQQAVPADRRVNPETGFSRNQARQILRTFADEDTELRPPIRLPIDEPYKNW